MTYCAPDDPDWVLHAETLEIDPISGDAQAWGAKLKVANVPVLYCRGFVSPWTRAAKPGCYFPISAATPGAVSISPPQSISTSRPTTTCSIDRDTFRSGGFYIRESFRWLSEEAGYWELDGGWIGDDSKYEDEFPLEEGSRWLVGTKHNGRFGDHWHTYINYTRVSDTEYLRDLNNSNLSAQRETALQQLRASRGLTSSGRSPSTLSSFNRSLRTSLRTIESCRR